MQICHETQQQFRTCGQVTQKVNAFANPQLYIAPSYFIVHAMVGFFSSNVSSVSHASSFVLPVTASYSKTAVATISPQRPRKPSGYWSDPNNLYREIRQFIIEHVDDSKMGRIPPASKFRVAGRMDIIQGIRRHGGFIDVAASMQLTPSRRPRNLNPSSPVARAALFLALRRSILRLADQKSINHGCMPSASQLRTLGEITLLNDIVLAGGFSTVAQALSLKPARYKTSALPPSPSNMIVRQTRRAKHYWKSWRVVETELHKFAIEACQGFMPLQRQFVEHTRTDLLNAIRQHGGLALAAQRTGLQPPLTVSSRRPRGYWLDSATLHAEILAFTAKNGYPGMMPTCERLRKAGRVDLVYAINRYGGFATLASKLHLTWYGPSSYWRVFRNVRSRLLSFMKSRGDTTVLPSVPELHKAGRFDLIYGIALHGGVMSVSRRMRLKVVYPQRDDGFWKKSSNVIRELETVLQTQPVEVRHIMPTSVKLVQLGRADLATAIRDHGGWLYYAQSMNLRFAFEVRPRGFWQHESNVLKEVLTYMDGRYGDWEHPGKALNEWDEARVRSKAIKFIPPLDMLKRDGRSDVAAAIGRQHGGIEEFARRYNFVVSEDVVTVAPFEKLTKWPLYVRALEQWIEANGTQGIMPSKQDLIMSGRHDLRHATWTHGGLETVSKRLQLVFVKPGVENWLPQWLGRQAGKFGIVLNLRNRESIGNLETQMLQKFEAMFNGSVLGKSKRAKEMGGVKIPARGKIIRRKKLRVRSKKSQSFGGSFAAKRLSKLELDQLRERYQHIPPDDLISVS